MGEVLGADGRPTCSPLTQQRMKDARPTSAFDVNKAVTAMVSDLENRAGAGPVMPAPPLKPAAAGPSLLGRVARVFGRRQT